MNRLEELASKIGSGATPTGGKDAYLGGNVSLIRSMNVRDMEFDYSGLAYISNEQARKLDSVTVQAGDVLFNITGDSIARCCVVPEDVIPARVNQHVAIIRPADGVDGDYLCYYLQYLKAYLLNLCKVGGTRNALTKEALEGLVIDYPVDAAKRTAVLHALDDKIALNKKMIAELEKTARLIYDYWFMQFDFPDENGKPYRSSGGKMVYNETLKREIPAGWEAGTLGDLGSYGDCSIDNSMLGSDGYVSTDNMLSNRGGIVDSQYLPETGISTRFDARDILLSNIRPYFKKIWLADRTGGCCNDVLVIHPDDESVWAYLYWTVENDAFFAYDVSGAKGSKMPRGDRDHIMRYPVAIPPLQLLTGFTKRASSMTDTVSKLRNESRRLSALRDWLLPMLMNGQVTVGA